MEKLDTKKLGLIFNDDTNNILHGARPDGLTTQQYQRVFQSLLSSGKPGIFASDVGYPDPVFYRSEVATYISKYYVAAQQEGRAALGSVAEPGRLEGERAIATMLDGFLAEGTDMVQMMIDCCRQAHIPFVASYRMNAEDFYYVQLLLSDFGREHEQLAIPGRHCLDPACPEVYAHRLDIFREFINKYDIAGIELNFRRWCFMISHPLHNHPVLTRMVRDVRRILDDAALSKGKPRPLLGVRVGPLLEGPFVDEEFPGQEYGQYVNPSCRDLGLDVRNWVESGCVDYICPMLFLGHLPGLPRIREFVDLAKGTPVGIYPTLWSVPRWVIAGPDQGPIEAADSQRMLRYKQGLCESALSAFDQGAHGLSTFNWYFVHQPGFVADPGRMGRNLGPGGNKLLAHFCSIAGDRDSVQAYHDCDTILP